MRQFRLGVKGDVSTLVTNGKGGHGDYENDSAKAHVMIGETSVGDPSNYAMTLGGTAAPHISGDDSAQVRYQPSTPEHNIPYRGTEDHGIAWEKTGGPESPDDRSQLPDGMDGHADDEPEPLDLDLPITPVLVTVDGVAITRELRPKDGRTNRIGFGAGFAGTTNPCPVLPQNPQRKDVMLYNSGATLVYLGFSELDSLPSTGFPFNIGASIVLEVGNAVWASVAAGSTGEVAYIEQVYKTDRVK